MKDKHRAKLSPRAVAGWIEQHWSKRIVGHERQGVTQQKYFATGYTLIQRRDAIEKLRFDYPTPSLIETGLDEARKGTERVA
ncbi:hypothetical protein IVB38_13845 [Bradyrhizobium sp. 38]|uniref:hypothetical protein n=1 Tax=unclassified Bradyrhizobium TaxID=2631580 RepID=UPI001FFB850A|nr:MULTISPECIES: hypothetical protein [unclassified Bradyrhizobium]MCK1337078.1 hypothetical protein [Bradyrhizobium sp. 38]MCK1778355.1 hypothetical protein [Bradyrhizobium sp. 132]